MFQRLKKLPFDLTHIIEALERCFIEIDACSDQQDLVIVLGQTGSGKSTLMASLLCGPHCLNIKKVKQ